MIHIIALDDHPLILDALENAISKQNDMQLVATADHGSNLIGLVRKHQPDIAIVDLGMSAGEFDPIASIREIKKQFQNVKVLVLTNYASGVWVRALVEAGVSGYMLKSDAFSRSIVQAIRAVYAGDRFFSPQIAGELIDHKDQTKLTPQEKSILMLLDEGKSTEAVADKLGVSVQRIRNLLVAICDKLEIERGNGVSPRFAAINRARKLGLLPDNEEMDANLVAVLSRTEADERP